MRCCVSAVVVGASTLVGATVLSHGQSLGDLARKTEESRRNTKEPVRVYTNKDVRAVRGAATPTPSDKNGATTPAGDSGAQAVQQSGSGPAPDTALRKDREYWTDRMKSLHAQLERDRLLAAAMQTRINVLTSDLVNNDQGARPAIEQDRGRAISELARLQKAIVDGTKAIADLEEEARRAGVPPGWLR
jgi:hypothetical protein